MSEDTSKSTAGEGYPIGTYVAEVPVSRPVSRDAAPKVRSRDGAYELKFLVTDEVAHEVLKLARSCMMPDPNALAELHDGYHISSIYFDTPELHTFQRLAGFRRRKLRLRRYGGEHTIYLERKSKSNGIVRKRRVGIEEPELNRLTEGTCDPQWIGHWFHRRLLHRQLRPTSHVTYDRIARVEASPHGPIRLTVDRNIRCQVATEYRFPAVEPRLDVLAGSNILELKFRESMPAFFKVLMRNFSLAPTSVSKYRMSVSVCGLQASLPATHADASARVYTHCRESSSRIRSGDGIRSV